MSETLQTSFSNTEAKGRITLFRNYLDGGHERPAPAGENGVVVNAGWIDSGSGISVAFFLGFLKKGRKNVFQCLPRGKVRVPRRQKMGSPLLLGRIRPV